MSKYLWNNGNTSYQIGFNKTNKNTFILVVILTCKRRYDTPGMDLFICCTHMLLPTELMMHSSHHHMKLMRVLQHKTLVFLIFIFTIRWKWWWRTIKIYFFPYFIILVRVSSFSTCLYFIKYMKLYQRFSQHKYGKRKKEDF